MTNMHIGVLIGANFRRGIRAQFAGDVSRREGCMRERTGFQFQKPAV